MTCRKAQAAAFASAAGIPRDKFRWISGEGNLNAYESSPGKFRRFCATCGSHILSEHPERRYLMLRVATLDDDPGVRPSEHIWVSQDAPWLKDPNTVARHPEWHPEY
jgi:ADP-ribosyl-[dinitrogen reductase] hydrolase